MLKNLVRILALVLMLIFFLPTLLVSCQGENMEISAYNIAAGDFSAENDDITKAVDDVDAMPIFFIILLLAIVIFILGDKQPIIGIVCAVAEIISIIWMYEAVKDYIIDTFDGFASTETTAWYVIFIIIACIIIISLVASMLKQKSSQPCDDFAHEEFNTVKSVLKNIVSCFFAISILFTSAACDNASYLKNDIASYAHNNSNESTFSNEINPNDLSYLLSDDKTYYSVCRCLFSATNVEIVPTYNGLPVTKIEDYAFSNCEKLESISIPDSITEIGYDAFAKCYNLKDLVIGSSVSEIDSSCFDDCYNLKSITVVPENQHYVSSGNCLIEIDTKTLIRGCGDSNIPSDGSVNTIAWCAFYGTSIENITIPDSVSDIEAYAFASCYNLTEIIIPSSVNTISGKTFANCRNLTDIYFEDSSELWPDSKNMFSDCNATVHWNYKHK